MGQLASNIGSWMQLVATGWLVLQLTDSPAALGINAACQALPILLFSVVGGVFADRFNRHRLMLGAQLAQLVPDLTLALLVSTGRVQVWHIYLYSLSNATIRGLSTPARQAFVPSLVPREALLSAIALNSILWQGAAVVGPTVAGVVLAAWGLAACFWLNVASDLVNVAALLLIPGKDTPRPSVGSAWQRLAEGARYAWREPRVRLLLFAVGTTSLLGRSYTQLMPVFARDVLAVGPRGLGLLLAMPAVGTILVALGLATLHLTHKGRWLLATMTLLAVALGVFALSQVFVLSLAVLVLVGASATASTTLTNTLLQEQVTDHVRGRVMGFYMAATQGASPLGALPGGLLAELLGAPLAVLLGAGCLLACALGLTLRTPTLRHLD
ncbi:MAG: MFS transporter [Chloroflexi bacterium]|nr:MFS transporter [Chloroflexota bacterium]